jgi:hypothetical protein
MLGAVGGVLVSTTQYTFAPRRNAEWSGGTYSALTMITATGGAVGGYAFGSWFEPDPRSLGLIASASGFGMLTGGMIGAGASRTGDTSKGASLGGLLGYGAGVAGGGVLSAFYKPSWNTQAWMWAGYGIGAASTSIVYAAYLFTDGEPKRGLIANAVGGIAGMSLAAILTYSEAGDASRATFTPPFQVGFAPTAKGGGMLTAYGAF